jgi:SsrA-binding protein
MSEPEIKPVCRNRRARFQYEILETVEAGLVLHGSEVKSLRAGRANLTDGYARIRRGEAWLVAAHIDVYPQANQFNHEPKRERKLLLAKRELVRLDAKLRERGLTLVPISIYFRGGWAKVELALARGKRMHDKRQAIARRETERRLRGATKRRVRGR